MYLTAIEALLLGLFYLFEKIFCMKKTLQLSVPCIIAMLATQSIFAQQKMTDTVSENTLIPVEIKGIRINNKSPFAISNLGSDYIQRQNTGQDIPYILDQTPSVIVNSDAGTGVGYTDMCIRGTDNARINFTLNGIPLNDAESQGAFFVDFPDMISSINSIQVQRGVGSSTNGAGAFGASVNMSNLAQNDTAYATIFNSYGSFNTWHNMLKAGTGLLPGGFNFDIRLSRQSSDGYIDRSYADLKSLQLLGGWHSKNNMTSLKFNLLSGKEHTGQAWNGVPEDSLKTNRRFNELGLKADSTYYNDQSDNYRQDYYQLFFNHRFNEIWSANIALFLTSGIGYYNEYKLDQGFQDYGLKKFTTPANDTFSNTNLIRQQWLDNYYYGIVYSLQYHKKNTDFTIGGAATKYDGKHYGIITWADYGVPDDYEWYRLNAFKKDANVYAKWQQHIAPYFDLFADIQYRNVGYTINGFKDNPGLVINKHYNFINPKIGLSFIKNHRNNSYSKAYISFAIANKEPNRDDFEASPQDLPKVETLYDAEAGYRLMNNIFSLNAGLYYMYYKDQLILTGKINDVGAYTRTNVPNSYRAGIELSGNIKPIAWMNISATATFSENKIKSSEEYYDDYDNGGQIAIPHANTDIALSPAAIAGLGLSVEPLYNLYPKKNLWVELYGKYISRQYLDNTSNKNRSIDPYSVANLKVQYYFSLRWIKELGLTLAVNNIFNTKYESKGYTYSYLSDGAVTTANYYFPQAGINFMMGVSLHF